MNVFENLNYFNWSVFNMLISKLLLFEVLLIFSAQHDLINLLFTCLLGIY
jgi:hypothetical protein